MLLIQRKTNGHVIFALSGRIEVDRLSELHRLIHEEGPDREIVLDLRDVTVIGREAMKFLSNCEAENMKLENCPAYIREWIDTDVRRSHRRKR